MQVRPGKGECERHFGALPVWTVLPDCPAAAVPVAPLCCVFRVGIPAPRAPACSATPYLVNRSAQTTATATSATMTGIPRKRKMSAPMLAPTTTSVVARTPQPASIAAAHSGTMTPTSHGNCRLRRSRTASTTTRRRPTTAASAPTWRSHGAGTLRGGPYSLRSASSQPTGPRHLPELSGTRSPPATCPASAWQRSAWRIRPVERPCPRPLRLRYGPVPCTFTIRALCLIERPRTALLLAPSENLSRKQRLVEFAVDHPNQFASKLLDAGVSRQESQSDLLDPVLVVPLPPLGLEMNYAADLTSPSYVDDGNPDEFLLQFLVVVPAPEKPPATTRPASGSGNEPSASAKASSSSLLK